MKNLKIPIVALVMSGLGLAVDVGQDISKPAEMVCDSSGNIISFTCNIMQSLLQLGPMVAVIALVLGGIIHIYSNVFVTADQRGKYHSVATSLVVGAIILAALVGGAGLLVSSGMKFLAPGSGN